MGGARTRRTAVGGGAVMLLSAAALACEYRPLPLDREGPAPAALRGDGGAPLGTPAVVRPAPGGCDPVAQPCGAIQRCAADCERLTYACVPRHREAQGTQGHVCSHDEDCAAGYVCLERPSRTLGGGARCLRYCASSRDCRDGSGCLLVPVACELGTGPRFLERRLCVYL